MIDTSQFDGALTCNECENGSFTVALQECPNGEDHVHMMALMCAHCGEYIELSGNETQVVDPPKVLN